MGYNLSPRADRSLIEIWEYTRKNWGEEKADSYIHDLHAAMAQLAQDSRQARYFADRRLKGIFYCRMHHHFIFFRRIGRQDIDVLSVLHERMDILSHLKKDEDLS